MERIGESKLAMMEVLWGQAPLTVAEVAARIDPARDGSDCTGRFRGDAKTGYRNVKRLCSLLCGGLVIAGSTAGLAQTPAATPQPAAPEMSEVIVVGKRMPPAEAPASRTCEAYVQSDPAFRNQILGAMGNPLLGPRIYLPTRTPRNPDYSAPPTVAPGTPVVPAKPYWDPSDLSSSAAFDAAGGAGGGSSADFSPGDDGAGVDLGAGTGQDSNSITLAIDLCRSVHLRGFTKPLPSMITGIPGSEYYAVRSYIAGRDTTLPTAFALFEQGRYQESLSYFQQARTKLKDEEGGAEAGLMIGKLHLFAPIAGANPAEGLKWLEQTAMSPFNPAIHMPVFDPAEPDRNTAIGEAAVILGNIYLKGSRNIRKSPATAMKWFQRANDVGHVAAAKTVGDLYYQGRGAPRDLKQAAKYYKQAATLDHAPAQFALAEMLYRGDLSAPDIKGALAWYARAAKHKHPGALYALALAYESGEGVEADPQKALAYYKDAALGGNISAQAALGTYFYTGEQVPKDHPTARKWFEAAAAQGDPDAMFNLAVMLMKGEGGEIDRTKAWAWLRAAQQKGLPKAAAALVSLEQRMTPEERAAAGELFAPKRKS